MADEMSRVRRPAQRMIGTRGPTPPSQATMRLAFAQDGISVFDQVLTETEISDLESWAEKISYRGVHHGHWRSVWRLNDGVPLRGPTWTAGRDDDAIEGSGPPRPLRPLANLLCATLLRGARLRDRISLTPWIYPPGTALGLHRDDGAFAGSYSFYLTREWDVHWGGLLHCVTEGAGGGDAVRAIFRVGEERSSVAATGRGLWIAPAWNRLVLLEPQVRHFISRVDANAGDRVRLSIAGFVHRAELAARR